MSTITRIDLPRSLRREDLRPLPARTNTTVRSADPLGFPGYADKLADLAQHDESLTVGLATLAGRDVVVALGDFSFLGGSMGRVHGDRVAHAMEVALERRLPFLAVTASGGARMQEGMVSLLQMARGAEGIRRLRDAGLPVLAHFTHPTTGGVHASYGALADVVVADAGATIGFAGPRVVEAFTGEPIGEDSHTAEAALRAGLVDVVAAEGDAPLLLADWVDLLHPALRHGPLPAADHVEEPVVEHDAWQAVQAARRTDRPSARDLLAQVFDDHLELRGDRAGEDDPAVVTAVARLGQRRVMVLGFDRRGVADAPGRQSDGAPRMGQSDGAPRMGRPGQATAAGFRKLRRAAELARRWQLPLVTFVDTPGADPSPASDRAGLAAAIAETFVAVLAVEAPTVAVVTGEGGSGGALAIGACDRLLMQDDAVFEVIAPEGAASILHRDPTRAEEVAPLLKPTASALRQLGICDRVVPGPTTFDAHTAGTALRAELAATLADLDAQPDRLAARHERYGA